MYLRILGTRLPVCIYRTQYRAARTVGVATSSSHLDMFIAADLAARALQQQEQRAAGREDAGEEWEEREDRARRTRTGNDAEPVAFMEGNLFMHDLLGEAILRAMAREDGKVKIEWARTRHADMYFICSHVYVCVCGCVRACG